MPELIERLRAGATIALISDAGTPAISDPGYRLVRAAHEAGIRVAAVPGPSAAIAALSISGIATNRFVFEGFLPSRDSSRRGALEALRQESRTMIFYEAARRLSGSLSIMAEIFGADRGVAVIREITKTHEEIVRGTLAELTQHFIRDQALGEIVLVLEGAASKRESSDGVQSKLTVEDLTEAGLSLKQASALIAKLTGASRRDIYNQAVKIRRETD